MTSIVQIMEQTAKQYGATYEPFNQLMYTWSAQNAEGACHALCRVWLLSFAKVAVIESARLIIKEDEDVDDYGVKSIRHATDAFQLLVTKNLTRIDTKQTNLVQRTKDRLGNRAASKYEIPVEGGFYSLPLYKNNPTKNADDFWKDAVAEMTRTSIQRILTILGFKSSTAPNHAVNHRLRSLGDELGEGLELDHAFYDAVHTGPLGHQQFFDTQPPQRLRRTLVQPAYRPNRRQPKKRIFHLQTRVQRTQIALRDYMHNLAAR